MLVLVVSTLGKRAKTEIDIGLTKIEAFGSSLLVTTIPSESELFFPTFWRLIHSYPSVSPRSWSVKDRLMLSVIAANYRCAAKFGYLLYLLAAGTDEELRKFMPLYSLKALENMF